MNKNSLTVGVTGANGFVGRHLVNYLNLQEDIQVLPLDRAKFTDLDSLSSFVSACDTIVHLAAVNRHDSDDVLYKTNINLVERLIEACISQGATPHILISSSTQEDRDNVYGRSKKKGRELLETWAQDHEALTTGMIIPNVFGPFGKPYYNSVVATFAHLLANGGQPEIHQDSELQLIYINELIEDIRLLILNKTAGMIYIEPRHQIKVSDLYRKLASYKEQYLEKGVFPNLDAPLELALFNTYRTYVPTDHYPVKLKQNTDDRGCFVEVTRSQGRGQFSYSTTKQGVTRGNHFHTRKAERFTVISGKAKIALRKIDTDETLEYLLDGNEPAYVDMPIWYTHNITNIGKEDLLTLFWINEAYDPEDPDTYFINV